MSSSKESSIPGAGKERRAIERAAAQWTLRQQEGLSAQERQVLADWLRQDARHAEVFAEMQETAHLLDGLHEPASHARSTPLSARPKPAGFPWWRAATLAAAAAVALVWVAVSRQQSALRPFASVVETGVGDLRELALPDGSTVRLNTDSVLDVFFTETDRRVRLTRGEAFFAVAKDPRRPFNVEAGKISVRAVGTAFNVRYHADAVEVLVTEGKVSLDDEAGRRLLTSADEPLLVAGRRALIPTRQDVAVQVEAIVVATVEARAIDSALAWQERRLEFSATPLADIVAEFNRYNQRKLVIADSSLAEQRYGGAFALQGYESFLELLEQTFDVVVERGEREIVLRSRGRDWR